MKSYDGEGTPGRRAIRTLDGRGKSRKLQNEPKLQELVHREAEAAKRSGPSNDWSLPELRSRYTKGQSEQDRQSTLSLAGKDSKYASRNVDNLLQDIKVAIGQNEPVTGETRSILKKILANNRGIND